MLLFVLIHTVQYVNFIRVCFCLKIYRKRDRFTQFLLVTHLSGNYIDISKVPIINSKTATPHHLYDPPWVFFTFLKLCKWYQIAQQITYLTMS